MAAGIGVGFSPDKTVRIEIGDDIVVSVRYRKLDGTILVETDVPEGTRVIVRDAATVKDSVAKAKSNGNHAN